MKKIILNLTVIAVLATTIATLNGQDPDENSVATEDKLTDAEIEIADAKKIYLAEARKDFITDFQKFKKGAETKIKNNEISIADLKSEIMQMNVKDKSAIYQKEVSGLEQNNNKLKKELNDYKNEGSDKWATYKIEFNRDMDELGKALKDFTINE